MSFRLLQSFITACSNNDGDWKIDVDQKLLNALTGGLSSVGEDIEGSKLNLFGK